MLPGEELGILMFLINTGCTTGPMGPRSLPSLPFSLFFCSALPFSFHLPLVLFCFAGVFWFWFYFILALCF